MPKPFNVLQCHLKSFAALLRQTIFFPHFQKQTGEEILRSAIPVMLFLLFQSCFLKQFFNLFLNTVVFPADNYKL